MATKLTDDLRKAALRAGFIIEPKLAKSAKPAPEALRNAATVELLNCGFMVSPAMVKHFTLNELVDLVDVAKELVGADRNFKPIYPGFPKQVEELSTETLIIEQILHYMSGGALLPNYPEIPRASLPLADMLRNARPVELLTSKAELTTKLAQAVQAKVAMSPNDRELVKSLLKVSVPTLKQAAELVAESSNGENVQVFVEAYVAASKDSSEQIFLALAPELKHADALLRVTLSLYSAPSEQKWKANYNLAVSTLAGDKARSFRMGKLPRSVRRELVRSVGRLSDGYKADTVFTKSDYWRRVMKAAHSFEHARTEEEKRALAIIHGNVEYKTFNSLVEAAMEKKQASKVIKLLVEHQPGNLLRRLVAIMRIAETKPARTALAKAVRTVGAKSTLSTLISSYNGVLAANDSGPKVTRVAGLHNKLVERTFEPIDGELIEAVKASLLDAIKTKLAQAPAPKGPVAIESTVPVSLVKRDAALADRTLMRGERITFGEPTDTLRIFSHFRNNQGHAGYMDIGAVVLDGTCEVLAVSTWDTYYQCRDWSTYSGDKNVHPGDEAAEFFDIKLPALRQVHSDARYIAMTIQSYSGWPVVDVDIIAGAMFRSDARAGEAFDARTVATAFKPTTTSLQAVPLVFDLKTNELIWIDSSSGSTQAGGSSSGDKSVGPIVMDELVRERLTYGDLATLWAEAHQVETRDLPVNVEELDALL